MKRSILGGMTLGLALLLSAPAGAQIVKVGEGGAVDVNAGGTVVNTGKKGTKVNAGGTVVNTGKKGTRVNAGGTVVNTGKRGTTVKAGGTAVGTGKGGTRVRAGGVKIGRRGVRVGGAMPKGRARHRTIVCKGNQTKTLKNVVISAPKGDAVIAKGNCDLTLIGATLQGRRAVVAEGNATVKIVRSTLQGGAHAILAGGSSDVSIKNSVISGKLTTKGSADITRKGGNTIN